MNDVGRYPVPGDDEAPGPLIRRAAAADERLALGVLAGRDGLDLVVDQDRPPTEDRLESRVDSRIQRIDRPVAGRLGGLVDTAHRQRNAAGGLATVRRGDAPPDELDG